MRTIDPVQQRPLFEAHLLDDQDLGRPSGKNNVASRSAFFEMIWIKKGEGSCRVDMQKFPIADDTLYCLFPGQLYFFDPIGEVTGFRIAFSQDFLTPDFGLANRRLSPGGWDCEWTVPIIYLNGDFQEEIDRVVREMVWEYQNDFPLRFEILKGLLKVFVAYFSTQFKWPQTLAIPTSTQPIFENFIGLVEKKFATHKLVNQYADELAVTPNYLSEVVKRSSGFSATHFIHKRIILEAKRMAVTSDVSMKEIAFQIGFEDACQFSKFFKLKTGSNFSDFRKTLN
jgi:AraC family transcriptional activator of pobA